MSEPAPPNCLPRKVIYAALAADLAIAAIKFSAAGFTGSSAMLSEGIHSMVDSINELLLIYGTHRANLAPDADHPFGYGRELYFWSFIVALMVMGLGAGLSLYDGVTHLLHPEPMRNPFVNYVVLGLAFLCEAYSWSVAFRAFHRTQGERGYFAAFLASKNPSTFIVLFEDTVGMAGVLVAGAGIALARGLGAPRLDGAAAIAIGVLMAGSSLLLARETKGLLIGEAAYPEVRDAILRIAGEDPGVGGINGVVTIQMGPNQVLAALSAEFHDGLGTPEIERCVTRIEARVKREHPEVRSLFVKPQTAEAWARRE